METGKYELVIVWETGEKDILEYNDFDTAENGGKNMEIALGKQIAFWCVREQYAK